jgi:hypothetical protein
MAIIQKLADEPNDVGGLSAGELKAKFDEGGEAIKEWINESFIPEVEEAVKNSPLESIPEHASTHATGGKDALNPEDIGAARIQMGSYIGTGTAGPNETENTLTFDFVPRFVFVSMMGRGHAQCIFAYGATSYECSTSSMPFAYGEVSWSGTTMRWHTTSVVNEAFTADRQLNVAGVEYTYTAIG